MTLTAASGDNSRSLFATPKIFAERRADGSILVKSSTPLQPGARCIGDWLEHWARQAPDRIFVGDRTNADAPWSTVTYKDALRQVRAAGCSGAVDFTRMLPSTRRSATIAGVANSFSDRSRLAAAGVIVSSALLSRLLGMRPALRENGSARQCAMARRKVTAG